jgi:hypothetical protein
MIDAKTFASSYGTFWKIATPTIDLLTRKINLEYYERVEPPLDIEIDPKRSSFLSETAFSLFFSYSKLKDENADNFSLYIEGAIAETRKRLKKLSGVDLDAELDDNETSTIIDIYRRLIRYFPKTSGRELVVRPVFPGCGFIDESEGDVVYGNTLYEIKTVDRNFRSVDLKQVISYAALNKMSEVYEVRSIGLYNPRRGTEIVMDIDSISFEISGLSASELVEFIIYSITSGEISR